MKMRDKYPRLFTMMSVGLLLMVIGLFFMLMSCVGSFNEMEWAKTNTPLFISVVLFLLGAMLFFTARQMFKTRKTKNEQVELQAKLDAQRRGSGKRNKRNRAVLEQEEREARKKALREASERGMKNKL